MFNQFKQFLKESNALTLAIGVIIGGASGKLVTGLVDFIMMPLISVIMPDGDWKSIGPVLKSAKIDGKVVETKLQLGAMAGAIIDFLIIMLVMYYITKMLLKPAPAGPAPRTCPFCGETVPDTATRCKACTSDISATAQA